MPWCRAGRDLLGAVGVVLALTHTLRAEPVDFSGKLIEITVPYTEGGGDDIWTRFWAPLIARNLPGRPKVIIRNAPGAGAIAGSNQFQEYARADGTSLASVSMSVTMNYVFKDPRVTYRLDQWTPIILSQNGSVVYVNAKTGAKGPQDLTTLLNQQLVVGANNPTGSDLRALLAFDLLGLKFKPVFGMNRGDIYPLFERGEVTMDIAATSAFAIQVKPLVDQGIAVPIFSLGFMNDQGQIVRDPTQPNLPTFEELYEKVHGTKLSGAPLKAWVAVFKLNVMATRSLCLPAGVSKEVVETYHSAVVKALAQIDGDPVLRKKARELLGPEKQATGEVAAKNLHDALTIDQETYAWLSRWVSEKYGIKL